MKTLNDSNVIQFTDVFQMLKVVIVVIVVYTKLPLFTKSICFILRHLQCNAQIFTRIMIHEVHFVFLKSS